MFPDAERTFSVAKCMFTDAERMFSDVEYRIYRDMNVFLRPLCRISKECRKLLS